MHYYGMYYLHDHELLRYLAVESISRTHGVIVAVR